MKYKLTDIIVHKGTFERGLRAGQPYYWAQASLFNDEDPLGNPAQLPAFFLFGKVAEQLSKYGKIVTLNEEKVILVDDGLLKKAVKDEEIPNYRTISNVFPTKVQLTGQWIRVDSMGKPVVGKSGAVVPFEHLVVYAKKVRDADTGELTWVEDPQSIANRILERTARPYVPVNQAVMSPFDNDSEVGSGAIPPLAEEPEFTDPGF